MNLVDLCQLHFPMNEFSFLKNLRKHFNLDLAGDDCAVLNLGGPDDLLVTSDVLAEGIDFRLEWSQPEFLGHKALAVSLSDLAAMGGEPRYAMVSLAIPDELWNDDFLDRFYAGFMGIAGSFDVKLAGGDLSESRDGLFIECTAIGTCAAGTALLRSGAQAGDIICVSGDLGAASAGLELIESGNRAQLKNTREFAQLVEKQLKPTPQVRLGNYLRLHALATSAIDLSDGLSSDLGHLCDASAKGALVDERLIPVDPLVVDAKEKGLLIRRTPLELALNGGEDFQLLFTCPDHAQAEVENLGCIVLGNVTDKAGVLELFGDEGVRQMPRKGFEHFANA